MLSVPEGKATGATVLGLVVVLVSVLLFSASKILTLPVDPVVPELALPPQAVSPTSIAEIHVEVHKQSHVFRYFCVRNSFLNFKNASSISLIGEDFIELGKKL